MLKRASLTFKRASISFKRASLPKEFLCFLKHYQIALFTVKSSRFKSNAQKGFVDFQKYWK